MEPKESKSSRHFYISMIKSGIRVLGYGLLTTSLSLGASLLVLAEVGGILEEL